MKKTEIIILTGFLGSGKTTLLKQCLQTELANNRKIAVVMNEIGKISIDSNEVSKDVRLKELLNGCVCCTMKDQLEIQLLSLVQNNELDCIYIETTGVANTIDVIDACTSAQTVESLVIKGVLSTVDASRWLTKNELSPTIRYLLIQQISYSNLLFINRLQNLSTDEKEHVLHEIKSINPNIIIENTNINEFLSNLSFSETTIDHEKFDVNTSLKIKTYTHEQNHSYDKQQFEEFLRNAPSNLFRMKGYVSFKGDPLLYNVQYSNGLLTYEKELMKLPKRLVCIGENIDQKLLEIELNKLEVSE
ncbi:CobW family GTP-binding protein [Gottfriedia solisilvae]|uniref:Cobalamin biosynthesis protein n=1 Tax=Gottfriedia solisilvae TaxID=1516104 RepID=A0A8J3EYS8_9BACI|nr:GTP-binding protein [Gottfriedia solisilvae]GGI13651.1 cobalamin biosynthesis protein [Gottfriedia solisilvae]